MSGAERRLLGAHLRRVPPFRALLRSVEAMLLAEQAPFAVPVLDLGCGDGLLAALAFGGLDVGADPDIGSLAEARREASHRLLAAALGGALPLATGCCGTVISNSVLEHIPDVEPVLAEVARVLRPDGRLLATMPGPRFAELLLVPTVLSRLGLARAAAAYGRWFNRLSAHYHTDPVTVWAARLERAGLRLEHARFYFEPASHRTFELGHWLGVPRLVTRRLTGRWTLTRRPWANPLLERWLAPHCRAGEGGAYLFLIARR